MADPASPPPSEGGATAGGQLTTPAPAAAANSTKLFDSIERYRDYPIVYDALLKVKYKIERGTLGNCYKIVDLSEDHKRVLLNLPGEIKHFYFPPEDSNTYAYVDTDLMDGITFNAELIDESRRFYSHRGFTSVDEALKTADGLIYSALIQETFEHELAHLKIRCDRRLPNASDDTPGGNPLHAETGFGVQKKIREDNEDFSGRLLEVPRGTDRFRAPVHLVWGDLKVDDGVLKSFVNRNNLVTVSRDQLVEHLKYGGIEDPTSGVPRPAVPPAAPPAVVPAAASIPKRHRDGDDDEDNGGKMPRLSSPSSPTTRTRKHVESPVALIGKSPGSSPVALIKSPVAEEGPAIRNDEEELLLELYETIASESNFEVFDTMKDATLDAKFQNEAGLCPNSFSPSDRIYVSLTFCNTTSSDVYLKLARKNFPRDGLQVIIPEGKRGPKIIAARLPMVAKKLAPGESHTFAPRQLCAGPKVEGEAVRRLHLQFIPYWTPAKAGTYKVEFPLFKKEFSFVIREDDNESDMGACSKE